ncbi:site-specific integrase [Avibacterium sp. 20-15]|uniref:tyrosine-type recombinase/integrase n=1 Tax=unclassified Avibacterium TaxID=2685287 RepID=UPI0020272AFD|nr:MULTISPECIES: site-specific integrase [unclassified Avibacterium]MCW9733703.1 site-specific integrase [Avibacterium sp. 20-15]URL03553.1 site-specific integrase [Avibacterium sp. 20-132]
MPIRKNKFGVWQIDITTPSGQRIRRSAQTTEKKLAQELHDKLKHEYWQVEQLNKKPERTIEEALIRFLEVSQGQKDFKTKIRHTEYWRSVLAGRTLSSLTTDDIVNNLPTHKTSTGEKLSLSTQNRYRSSIMRVLSLAQKAGWIDSIPYIPKNKEPKVRVRWITQQQALELLNALQLSWMRDVCAFALATGARMTEILSLTWDKIDLSRNIAIVSSDVAKSGRARSLLLGKDALAVIEKRQAQQLSRYVFHRGRNKQIKEISYPDFNQALEKCNISDFRFHDLRHTWASWHVQNGTPLMVLKELGGWETLEMVKRYAHLNADHLLSYANHVKLTSKCLLDTTKFDAENDILNGELEKKKAVSY